MDMNGTFKRVLKNENGITLLPLNKKYKPMNYSNEEINSLPIKIIGRVVELRRSIWNIIKGKTAGYKLEFV